MTPAELELWTESAAKDGDTSQLEMIEKMGSPAEK